MNGNKKKGKGKGNSSKPNGNKKRLGLRQGNRAYNQQLRTRTKGKRFQRGAPGTGQGTHIKGGDCRCGACNTKSEAAA